MKLDFDDLFASPSIDIYEGGRHSVTRLRQLLLIIQDNEDHALWPMAIVNAASCLEWYARSALRILIDHGADQINPEARVLKELRLNYAVILQAQKSHLSIGAIVALSKNFSSFDEIDSALADLMKNTKPSITSKVMLPLSKLMDFVFDPCKLSKKSLVQDLNEMFKQRHELVHGSPRHLAFENELDTLFSKKDLIRYIYRSLQYVKRMNSALENFFPELLERSTHDYNANGRSRLENSDREIERLAKAIEARIANDAALLREFRATQNAWRRWRDAEAAFQSADWRGGTGRTAILLGYQTSFNLERLRSLESYLRTLDHS